MRRCSAASITDEEYYLDACCLNRLTDDQSQARIAEEAEAVEQTLHRLSANTVEWLSSAALEAETSRNPGLRTEGRDPSALIAGDEDHPP